MFRQLIQIWTQDEPLKQVGSKFHEMLTTSRNMLDLVTETLFSGDSLADIREEIYSMDRRVNVLEQEIRKLLLTKLLVAREQNVATCLILFSVVKDAERCGDYAKNIYQVFVESSELEKDTCYNALQALRARISYFFEEAATVFSESDTERAARFLRKAHRVAKDCDAHVSQIIDGETCGHSAAYVLLFRFFKRITRHLMNIVSAVVMPVDKLDYFDEDYRVEVEQRIANGDAPDPSPS